MQTKDYFTVVISVVALLFSFGSLIFTFLNFRRNATKLKINQLQFFPSPLGTKLTPNKLFLDGHQSPDLWSILPIFHLVIYLRIDNLSHTGITISNFIINDEFSTSKVNMEELKKELSIIFIASEECHKKELNKYRQSVPMMVTSIKPDDYTHIKIGDRIDSKSTTEGIIIISGNWNLYSHINDGLNKFTIVTPDKKFDSYVEIDKTVIPNSFKERPKKISFL